MISTKLIYESLSQERWELKRNAHVILLTSLFRGEGDQVVKELSVKAWGTKKSFKNAEFEKDVMCYSNSCVTDVIGSKKVGTILKYKAANTTPHIEHRKSFHEKLGLVTQS